MKGANMRLSSTFHRIISLTILVVFALAMGCSMEAEHTSESALIPPTTKVLDESTTQYLSSISEDGSIFTFSETTQNLESLSPGDIIVSDTTIMVPNGFLRKVTAVSKSGDEIVVKTIQATLEEAIKKGTIELSKTLTPNEISSRKSVKKGVSFKRRLRNQEIEGFYLALNDVILYDADGDLRTEG
ncbi:MAG: hypothetical protein U9N86_07915, partial [Bacteroidota bacterium]|nr:hypothetical protein [Bacteroidota bacterium]